MSPRTADPDDRLVTKLLRVAALLPMLRAATTRASGSSATNRTTCPGEPPIPIRAAVVDLLDEMDRWVTYFLHRCLALLGMRLPDVPLAGPGQDGQLPCPECGLDALRVNRTHWFVYCAVCRDPADPRRPRAWRWGWDGAEVRLLGQMIAARVEEMRDGYEQLFEVTDPDQPAGDEAERGFESGQEPPVSPREAVQGRRA